MASNIWNFQDWGNGPVRHDLTPEASWTAMAELADTIDISGWGGEFRIRYSARGMDQADEVHVEHVRCDHCDQLQEACDGEIDFRVLALHFVQRLSEVAMALNEEYGRSGILGGIDPFEKQLPVFTVVVSKEVYSA